MQTLINETIISITEKTCISFNQAILHTCKTLQILPSKQNVAEAKKLYNEVVAMKSSGISF